MKKKSNHNTLSTKTQKKQRPPKGAISPWLEDYEDTRTREMKPITEAFTHRFADEYMEWADKDSSLLIQDFFDMKKIPESTFYEWTLKYEPIKKAHAYAKRRIRSRRETGGMTRKYDPSFIFKSMGMYSEEWRAYNKYIADLARDDGRPQNMTIRLEDLTKDDDDAQSHKDTQD